MSSIIIYLILNQILTWNWR